MHSALNCVREYRASSMMLRMIMNSIFVEICKNGILLQYFRIIQKWILPEIETS